MQIEKMALEKSAEALLEKAADCFDLAKTQQDLADKQHEIAAIQHENADQQHEIAARQDSSADKLEVNADRLDALGHALEANAVEIMGDTEIVQRGQSDCKIRPAANAASGREPLRFNAHQSK
jgi:hypothetical protein